MRTAEPRPAGGGAGHGRLGRPPIAVRIRSRGARQRRRARRLWIWAGLALVLALALGLRLWGVGQGLPYVYNTDEDTLFMPQAIAMFVEGLNPHYFENPAAFTYALHLLLLARFGGGRGQADRPRARSGGRPRRHDALRLRTRTGLRRAAGHAHAVAPLPDGRAPLQPRGRAPGGGDHGGRLPARLLFPSGAQRRPDPRPADALAVRHGGHPAPRATRSTTCSPASASAWPPAPSTRAAS